MSALWTSEELARATGGQLTRDFTVTGVSIDTRTIAAGDLFVALTDVRDGHDFVAAALDKGAAGALVMHRPEGISEDAPLLIVEEVLPALERIGAAARARLKGQLIAITGSVGKTSTKEMLRVICAGQGETHAAEASYNNHWGVPLTLARMPRSTQFAIIEIGMSNPGEIAPLARLARPHVAMVTTVAPAHMAAFESLDGIAHEKASIFEGLKDDGIAIYHNDLEVSEILRAAWSGTSIAFGETGDAQLLSVELEDGKTRATARLFGQEIAFTLSTAGRHFAMNALACLCALRALGADTDQGARDLSLWQPPLGRGVREELALPNGALTLIDDAFNANPSSMRVALEVLARSGSGRKVAVLGDMLELGQDEQQMHTDIAALDMIQEIDVIHTVGPLMHHLHAALPEAKRGQHFDTALAAQDSLETLAETGDTVLVKGSKGSKVSLLVDAWRKLGHSEG